ncbi:hypothetical protein NON00_02725 [Roseomonas sp. GC11]|uniref:hypothetical protein n=1 Tax=Roseomonas sp. GC11 TaxID=2950546 RepID=UPI0021096805|nr:hypothetical protein [Roseomonas sp. GC11]MCQ4158841.1 hypothetical protein [Roseomonas sp. GC11]
MAALKVTYLTMPDRVGGRPAHLGERVILRGARMLMRAAVGAHEEVVRSVADDAPAPGSDIVVVCGMRQFNHHGDVGRVVERIAALARAGGPVLLNLGVGATYYEPPGTVAPEAGDAAFAARVAGAARAGQYRDYAGFDLVTCRDGAARAALAALGVAAELLPCPGFFAALAEPRPLLRRPRQLVSVLHGLAPLWNRVPVDAHDLYRRLWQADPSRVFLAHEAQDAQMLAALSLPHVLPEDATQLMRLLAGAESLVSLRLQSALPAWLMGLNVTLLGLDRRARLGAEAGAEAGRGFRVLPLRSQEEAEAALAALEAPSPAAPAPEAERQGFVARHLPPYVALIRAAVERRLGATPPPGLPPYSLAGAPLPEPMLGGVEEQYRRSLFTGEGPDLPVDPARLRSAHRLMPFGEDLRLVLAEAPATLVFGPYVRLPRGRWVLRGEILVEHLPPAATAEALLLRVTKGMPAQELAKLVLPVAQLAAGQPVVVDLPFDNPRDTGELETVLSLRGGSLPGAVLRLAPLRLVRAEAEAMAG